MTSHPPQRPRAAFIVQQHEEGPKRSCKSTIHAASSAQIPPLWPAAWQKPEPQVADATIAGNDPRPSSSPQFSRDNVWHRLTSDKSNKSKDPNPTKRRYDDMWQAGLARWVSAIIVLGLSAGIISKGPESPLLETAAANLACASLHFFVLGPTVAPRSRADPRPPLWYLAVLAVSTAMWAAASGAMFAVLSDSDEYVVIDLDKRGIGRLAGEGIGAGTSAVEILKNITIGCACCGAGALLCCLIKWWNVYKLYRKPATEEEVRDCDVRLNKRLVHL